MVPSGDFFPSDSHTMSQLSLGSFVEKIIWNDYSEILQFVAVHARMVFWRWAGLIYLPGYNRQLLRIDEFFSHFLLTQSKDSRFLVFKKGCFHSKYHVISLDVYCLFCNLVPISCKYGYTILQKGLGLKNKRSCKRLIKTQETFSTKSECFGRIQLVKGGALKALQVIALIPCRN